MLNNMPVEANLLMPKIDANQKELDDVAKVIVGGFGAKNTVSSGLRFASFASYNAEVNVTGAQKEQLEIAKRDYNGQSTKLNSLFNTQLPALEKEFEDAGGVLYNIPQQRRRFFDEGY